MALKFDMSNNNWMQIAYAQQMGRIFEQRGKDIGTGLGLLGKTLHRKFGPAQKALTAEQKRLEDAGEDKIKDTETWLRNKRAELKAKRPEKRKEWFKDQFGRREKISDDTSEQLYGRPHQKLSKRDQKRILKEAQSKWKGETPETTLRSKASIEAQDKFMEDARNLTPRTVSEEEYQNMLKDSIPFSSQTSNTLPVNTNLINQLIAQNPPYAPPVNIPLQEALVNKNKKTGTFGQYYHDAYNQNPYKQPPFAPPVNTELQASLANKNNTPYAPPVNIDLLNQLILQNQQQEDVEIPYSPNQYKGPWVQ